MPEILLLSNLAEGIKPGSSKSTVIGTEVPVHYRWFLATMVAILYLCFELELVEWVQDEAQWPEKRDFPTFLEWFDVESHSMVFDLAEGELEVVADDA